MDYQTFIQQATEFKKLDFEGFNKVIKFLTIADATHPWTVLRASELLNWVNEGAYQTIVGSHATPSKTSITERLKKIK